MHHAISTILFLIGIIYIYVWYINSSLSNYKYQKELEIRDIKYQTRERFTEIENRLSKLNIGYVDHIYEIKRLEDELRCIKESQYNG